MITIWHLFKREMTSYFYTSLGVSLLMLVSLLTGFNFYTSVSLLNHGPSGISIVEAFFNNFFLSVALLLLTPLLTMRLLAQEYRTGTIEALLTAPLSDFQIILAKFLGAFLFFMLLWVPSLFYFIFFWPSAHQVAAAGYGAYFGAYGMLLLEGAFYIAVGLMASTMTSHELIAATFSFCFLLFFFFGRRFIHWLPSRSSLSLFPEGLFFPVETMKNFSRGLIDTRSIVFYLTMTFLFLFLSLSIFQLRKWRQ